jgi:hypothetical protein
MKAAGAFNGRPRELRTRHNMRAIYDKDTHKNRDRHPILRRSLLRTVGGKGERLSAVSSIALPGYLVRAVADLSSKHGPRARIDHPGRCALLADEVID